MSTFLNKTSMVWHIIVNLAGNSVIIGLASSNLVPEPYAMYLLVAFNAVHVIVAFLADPTGK